jgi:Spy/CpxP family protein refolding chaperone
MSPRLRRTFPLLLLLGALGCSRPAPQTPETVVKRAAERRQSPLIAKLKLAPRKAEEVEVLFADVRAFTADYEVARVALIDEALRQIESGKLSRQKLEPLARRTIKEWEEALPAITRAANKFHRLLSPEERTRLIEIMSGESKHKSEEEKRQEREDRISTLLDLSAGQKTQLFGTLLGLAMSNYSLVTQLREAISEAKESFVKEDYDARKLLVVTSLDLQAVAELVYEALVETLEVLTPEQHMTLAAILKARLLERTTESARVEEARASTKVTPSSFVAPEADDAQGQQNQITEVNGTEIGQGQAQVSEQNPESNFTSNEGKASGGNEGSLP